MHVDPKALKASANFRLLETGLAYPACYSKLYPDLRQTMADAAVAARTSRTQLRDDVVLLPKLFRRLVD
ncbi:hypothetical protein G3I59_20540 [Amycolatopsis rubida]|uniref:Uncharacterized protein n=1 Tax=Amycolatopsis rubida TaxID=112413 RepID=A0A1I5NIF8_9PSEU|nr:MULTISPECIES: hypothetical protein [Amycolatopsis]MYW92934.1 hypothetical protein [Amycolatopsis rubida]NEC57921.1 hypothetical protein [Amycolatopsis rubida]OAP21657.1 hypothetical protein A4R44_07680 [Amycolatopsis sp. M39]SFP21598.1 hypothetical protein SAMN05421854_104412 [Amycolatopsis rubida]